MALVSVALFLVVASVFVGVFRGTVEQTLATAMVFEFGPLKCQLALCGWFLFRHWEVGDRVAWSIEFLFCVEPCMHIAPMKPTMVAEFLALSTRACAPVEAYGLR
ncbi:hypothetical protein BRADI_4g35913v3 [Brachypodium distachyon]|uniref:Secreted protein n=1 Tax=Brachypodium distachyon TaxID=15368 RepID=A0A0Q3EUH5_BRADI|nr:hypothetical protein BRADI_4g35913v3 [Brachypodium distachyon]